MEVEGITTVFALAGVMVRATDEGAPGIHVVRVFHLRLVAREVLLLRLLALKLLLQLLESLVVYVGYLKG